MCRTCLREYLIVVFSFFMVTPWVNHPKTRSEERLGSEGSDSRLKSNHIQYLDVWQYSCGSRSLVFEGSLKFRTPETFVLKHTTTNPNKHYKCCQDELIPGLLRADNIRLGWRGVLWIEMYGRWHTYWEERFSCCFECRVTRCIKQQIYVLSP